MKTVSINGRIIGKGHPVYIIAEMSGNHNQSFERATEIIHAMKESGADAVKIQTYTPDTLTIDVDSEYFQLEAGTPWEGKTLYQLYKEAATPWEWQPKLQKIAQDLGMDFFSTPFDASAVDFLEGMNVPAYKIASFELNDIPLITYVAKKGKPMIISTGMGSEQEIQEAKDAVLSTGNDQLIFLKCTSAYPSPASEANLNTIPDIASKHNIPVGLSDHTLNLEVPITAVALGACVIEKHFCMSRNEPGPDTNFSLEPQEFANMVSAIRIAESSLGDATYETGEKESGSKKYRRSLFVTENMSQGDLFSEKNVRSIRPAHGLPPKELPNVLGKTATKDIKRGTPLHSDLIS